MSEPQKKPGVAFWALILLVVLYLPSVGPLWWLAWNVQLPRWLMVVLCTAYAPLGRLAGLSQALRGVLISYGSLWVDDNGRAATPHAEPVPYVGEILGTALAAWLILTIVRGINSRNAPIKIDQASGIR